MRDSASPRYVGVVIAAINSEIVGLSTLHVYFRDKLVFDPPCEVPWTIIWRRTRREKHTIIERSDQWYVTNEMKKEARYFFSISFIFALQACLVLICNWSKVNTRLMKPTLFRYWRKRQASNNGKELTGAKWVASLAPCGTDSGSEIRDGAKDPWLPRGKTGRLRTHPGLWVARVVSHWFKVQLHVI